MARSVPLTDFGKWVVASYQRAGYDSLTAFATATGVNRNTLWHYLHGTRKPKATVCGSIAKALHVPPETVLKMAGLLNNEQLAFHRGAIELTHGQHSPETIRALEGLMADVLTDSKLAEMLKNKALTTGDPNMSEVLHHLANLNERLAHLESERLRRRADEEHED